MKFSETFEHTADIGIRAWGDSRAELYEALAEGLAELICPRALVRASVQHRLSVEAPDGEGLAVAFLGELAAWSQGQRMCVAQVTVESVTDNTLEAQISAEPLDASRHELGAEIKAVTYHALQIRQENDRWVGQVILDI